ncbi:hypothetical protein [Sandaracinus amylolyticus]|uniref:Uncharacterized protein n=1 Tax=Sandaracinus amylolyticus TaxID=927083 RepID=A0A0F6YHB0_9BACT|nr:hypothetical protein [Sandaracinus amylolyticus]AKF04857.1 hypothetical protein DB32_002006 [Sandaracinus amylolyticus]
MRALLPALVIALAALVPEPAAAQDARGAVVLVVDPGHARINPERLRRTIASTLGRELVRITDPQAHGATGTLTIAHSARARWLVRFDATGGSASTVAEITRPGRYDETIADAARRVIGEVEAATDVRSAPTRPNARSGAGADIYVVWVDEILDPFEHTPPPPRREIAIASEVIDPFAPIAARHRTFSEVLDPWGR